MSKHTTLRSITGLALANAAIFFMLFLLLARFATQAMLESIAATAVQKLQETERSRPPNSIADYRPPAELLYPPLLLALFLQAPWIAHQIRRRWFPGKSWQAAQWPVLLFALGGAAGHFLLFPWLVGQWNFRPTGFLFPQVLTLHAQAVLFAALLFAALALLHTRQMRPPEQQS